MGKYRKAGKVCTFAKELGIQFFCSLPVIDKIMDESEKAIARRHRFNRFKDGKWKEKSSISGEVGLYMDR